MIYTPFYAHRLPVVIPFSLPPSALLFPSIKGNLGGAWTSSGCYRRGAGEVLGPVL